MMEYYLLDNSTLYCTNGVTVWFWCHRNDLTLSAFDFDGFNCFPNRMRTSVATYVKFRQLRGRG